MVNGSYGKSGNYGKSGKYGNYGKSGNYGSYGINRNSRGFTIFSITSACGYGIFKEVAGNPGIISIWEKGNKAFGG